MTKLHQHIEEMRVRLAESSTSELALVRSLSEALRRLDEKLLREVRNVTLEHEARRTAILGEMLTLAARLCTLPEHPAHGSHANQGSHVAQAAPMATIEQHPSAAPVNIEPMPINGAAGDWRQAARNIEDELEYPFGSHLPPH